MVRFCYLVIYTWCYFADVDIGAFLQATGHHAHYRFFFLRLINATVLQTC